MRKGIKFYLGKTNLYQVYIHITLLSLAIMVVVLARQNGQLKANPSSEEMEPLRKGDFLSIDDLQPLEPNQSIDYGSSQLLFVFTTTCPYCKLNIENWAQITEEVGATELSIVGISLSPKEKTADYVAENNVDFPVYLPEDIDEFEATNRVNSVPMTIVRSEIGQVDKIWIGLLTSDQVVEIINSFSEPEPVPREELTSP